ncbi:MAG: helix-turn-helix transcriptional regulator [Solirubrobacteraceae bacterium]
MIDLPPATSSEDALAQPTRARLFELLGELGRPAGTVELAERLRLHPNGVRAHLERLERAGLVARARAPRPRGRPRDVWTIASDARPGGRAPHAYAELARWLARAMGSRPSSLRDIEATGRKIGSDLAPADGTLDASTLQSTLAALGFQPQMQLRKDDRLTFRLGNCPYRDAVRENQPVVCALHRGITRGLLDVLDPHAKLAGFIPRDPDKAGCLIELSGVHAAPDAK